MTVPVDVAAALSPFHHGEIAVQESLGVRDIEFWARKVIRGRMPNQHRTFYTEQPFLVAGARDGAGRPWATVLEGPDGFVTSPDAKTLRISAGPAPGDALHGALGPDADVGLLGIELATRRRNRVNGRIASRSDDALTLRVDQAFGNCPQYIRERAWHRVETVPGTAVRGTSLTSTQRDWIDGADTFFIASGFRGAGESPTYGMDVSHRGGARGFVRAASDQQVVFPDYAGNNHYNTIGNLSVDPRAGYLFIDFETGSLLQLTGRATIDWDSDAVARTSGAQRLIILEIDEVRELPSALGLRWRTDAGASRFLRLIGKKRESADVASFIFAARDGGALPDFRPGQHLPIEVRIPGNADPTRRTYSLSSGPEDAAYRITVKRQQDGLVSRHLHDLVEPGAIVAARAPAGAFTLPDGHGPLALVSAGVGVTPMVGMLRSVLSSGDDRLVWFIHGARDGDHHPLAEEVRALAAGRQNVRLHIAYSRPGSGDRKGRHYDSAGRVDGDLIAGLQIAPEADYFLCGPTAFMADIQADLERRGMPVDRIHTETFGPAS